MSYKLLNNLNYDHKVYGLCSYLQDVIDEKSFLNLFISDIPICYPELKERYLAVRFSSIMPYWFENPQERKEWLLNTIQKMENELKSKSLLGKIKLCLRRS